MGLQRIMPGKFLFAAAYGSQDDCGEEWLFGGLHLSQKGCWLHRSVAWNS